MPANAGLCALTHLDLDGGTCVEVALVHAETSRCDLYDRVVAVGVEILVQTALARVVVDAEPLRRHRKALVRVVADGTVAHRRKHDGHGQLKLRGEIRRVDAPRGVADDGVRLFPEEHACLHRLTQRIDGGIRHLRGVDEKAIPVDRHALRTAHGGQQDAAALRLLVDLFDGLVRPVVIVAVGTVGACNLECLDGADRDAAMAVHTFLVVGDHDL